eukprot:TRINITY_DN18210_c0_g1_i1.p1 TRINITY_DN18210_c0_g1~~TRINITY_DN18210_c0_g1_i1.p1  ORF type:complete len:329 (-),score=16.07 TRINITY_DN18210_c0_g1_i1:287-1273(-)
MWARIARSAFDCLPYAPIALVTGSGMIASKTFATRCTSMDSTPPSFSIGCYNVLCSTYAVKWKEQQGMGADGRSNWSARWPAMRNIIANAQFDVLCMQEVEHTDACAIIADLGPAYQARYFKHTKRPPDGVLIAVRAGKFDTNMVWRERDENGVAFGAVDLLHLSSGARVSVVTGHMRGKRPEQLKSFADFANDVDNVDVSVITADFNEDFRIDSDRVQSPFPETSAGGYTTLCREINLPQLSRPPNKQAEDQSSGKGKIDWIFVRGRKPDFDVELFRDLASQKAILDSHSPCDATGEWPSDHGCEALSVLIRPRKRQWWQIWRRSSM